MSGSEIAQLRVLIETECQALQNMMQLATVASHHTINARYKNLDKYYRELTPLVGEEQARETMCETYNLTVKNAKQGSLDREKPC